jgi:hypothetical protein
VPYSSHESAPEPVRQCTCWILSHEQDTIKALENVWDHCHWSETSKCHDIRGSTPSREVRRRRGSNDAGIIAIIISLMSWSQKTSVKGVKYTYYLLFCAFAVSIRYQSAALRLQCRMPPLLCLG